MEKEKEKNAPETEEEKKSETPPEEKKDEPPKEDKPEEKAPAEKQSDENGEVAKEETLPEETVPDVPQLSETDKLKAENLTLKTQLEAMKIGFTPDCLEDAVTLAEAIVKRDSTDITAALQAVAKKYPDWKSGGRDDKSKGKNGFKVGADSPKEKTADEDKLDSAFNLRKKK